MSMLAGRHAAWMFVSSENAPYPVPERFPGSTYLAYKEISLRGRVSIEGVVAFSSLKSYRQVRAMFPARSTYLIPMLHSIAQAYEHLRNVEGGVGTAGVTEYGSFVLADLTRTGLFGDAQHALPLLRQGS